MSDETKLSIDEQVEQNEQTSKLQELERERDEWKNKCLRLAADYDNFKKRISKEKIQWQQLITGKILKDVISLLDDIDRAKSAHASPQEALDVIHKQLLSLLSAYNVTEMRDITHFNPLYHEAVAHVPSAKHTSGDIVEVLQKGYLIGDEVLRPAKVAVAQ